MSLVKSIGGKNVNFDFNKEFLIFLATKSKHPILNLSIKL